MDATNVMTAPLATPTDEVLLYGPESGAQSGAIGARDGVAYWAGAKYAAPGKDAGANSGWVQTKAVSLPDGGVPMARTLVAGLHHVVAFAIVDNDLCFTDQADGTGSGIYRVPLAGGSQTPVATGIGFPIQHSLAVLGDNVYYTSFPNTITGFSLARVPKGGGALTHIVNTVGEALVASGDALFYADDYGGVSCLRF